MGLQIDPKTVIPCVRRRLCRLLPSLDILSTTLPVFSTGSRCGRYSVIAPIMLCTHRFTSDARAFMLLREASLDSMPDTPRRAHREHGSMFEFHFQALPLHSSTHRATEKTSRHHLRLTSPPRHHTAKRGRSFCSRQLSLEYQTQCETTGDCAEYQILFNGRTGKGATRSRLWRQLLALS